MAKEQARASPRAVAAADQAQLPELPEAAVVCILQHVPLEERLSCCALVCRSWAAAAAAAPADVDVWLNNSEHCQQLQHWLVKHAAAVVGLTASGGQPGDRWRPLQLPVQQLTQLRSLSLSGELKVQLPGVTTRRSTRKVRGCSLTGTSSSSAAGSVGSAAGAVLPQLQELTLWECELTVQLLSQLMSTTTLTSFHWSHSRVYHEPVIHSSDTKSQQLTRQETYAALWERLQLLPLLSGLKLSEGSWTAADIAPLSNLQRLQHLDLHLTIGWRAGDASGPIQLLAALQHLTQLQFLRLHRLKLHRVRPQLQQQGASYQFFSALTASTQLTALQLEDMVNAPVPQAAFQHMFPPGHVLPHLRGLHLTGRRDHPCVGAAQVAMIAASCPALQQLTLWDVTPEGFDTSCLAQLPSGVTRVGTLGWSRPVP